jgi:hypothetical protein
VSAVTEVYTIKKCKWHPDILNNHELRISGLCIAHRESNNLANSDQTILRMSQGSEDTVELGLPVNVKKRKTKNATRIAVS